MLLTYFQYQIANIRQSLKELKINNLVSWYLREFAVSVKVSKLCYFRKSDSKKLVTISEYIGDIRGKIIQIYFYTVAKRHRVATWNV